MILNGALAARLGRPDLAGQPRDPYGGTSGNPQIGAVGSIALASPGFSSDVSGRVTAGVLVLVLAGAVGIYLWTRNLQA
jgi:hypothetical protein